MENSTNNSSNDSLDYEKHMSFFDESEGNGLLNENNGYNSLEEKDKYVCLLDWHSNINYKQHSSLTVFDVASYILGKLGSMTTMKLHKLLYYTQAWSLVWDETYLFNEQIEAWANGPVIREMFNYHRGNYSIETVNLGNPDLLTDKQKETVDSVLEHYGDKSSQWLIELTHLENPWKEARRGLSISERGNKIISQALMSDYYSSL